MTLPLLVIGGGHGAEVAAYARDLGLAVLGAIDDAKATGPWRHGAIVGRVDDLPAICREHGAIQYITAVGDNAARRALVRRIEALGLAQLSPATLRHRLAWVGEGAQIGAGTLLAPGSLVTVDAHVGRHCIVNVKASVSHDARVGEGCNLNPGSTVCGWAEIGDGAYIGAAATVLDRRKVGAWSVVGAGSVVTQDVPEGVTVVGVPARIVRRQGVPA